MSRIAVIDDDPSVRQLCRTILVNEGYEVLEADGALAGLKLVQDAQPDLVLLDWMMPGTDGMDALRAMKGGVRTKQIPVVMLTALDGLPQITAATYSGADGYVTKPFEVDDLLSLVRRFIASQEPEAPRASPR